MKPLQNNTAVRKSLRLLSLVLLMAVCLAGCKTAKHAAGPISEDTGCLSAKVQLTVPSKNAVLTVNGTLKLVKGERMQLSFLMPILRTEVARVEVTPDEALLVDRMGKRYVRVTREELKDLLPRKATYARLEKLLYKAAKEGTAVLSAKDLGIHSLEKAKLTFSDFSDKPLTLTPTRLSAKYEQVQLYELLEMLMSL